MSTFIRARFDVHDGRQAEFEEVVLALCAQAKDEPGTLTYRFFAAGDGGYLVLEEYADAEAAARHNERAAPLLERVRECTDLAYIEFYGPTWPQVEEWVRSMPNAAAFPELRGAAG